MRRRQDAGQQKLALSLSCCPSKEPPLWAGFPSCPWPLPGDPESSAHSSTQAEQQEAKDREQLAHTVRRDPGLLGASGVLRDHRPGVHVLWVASRVAHPLQWVPCAPLLSPVWGGASILLSCLQAPSWETGCVAPLLPRNMHLGPSPTRSCLPGVPGAACVPWVS